MALTTVSTTDLYDFVNEIADPEPLALYPANFSSRMGTYHRQLDRIYVPARNNSGTVIRLGYVDPLLVDGSFPVTNFTQGVSLTGLTGCVVGQWNRTTDEQKLYTFDSAAGSGKLQERDPTTLQIVDADPYPNFRHTCTVVGSTVDGYYVSLCLDYAVFEEQGKLYIPHANVRYDGATYTEIAAEVDLATGLAIPWTGIPGKATSSPNTFQEVQIFNDTVDWMRIQFVDDDDSTHLAPKGYFILSEENGQAGTGAGGQASERAYVRIVEWNPTGASGTPNRVHKRVTLTSRIEFDETVVGTNFNNAALVFHPLSGRLYWIANNGFDPSSTGTNVAYRFSTTADLASITAPTPESTPRTAGTTAFFVEALGSLNERIPGVSVQFSLETNSTVLEPLDTSAGVGGAAAPVANIPIGNVKAVYEDDGFGNLTELELLVDYSYDPSTGVFTGVSPHWNGNDYYVSYSHFDDDLSPPLGTLLLPLVTTDSDGKARTRVRYDDDDDLVELHDKISAETV